jgi:hypothetical protein
MIYVYESSHYDQYVGHNPCNQSISLKEKPPKLRRGKGRLGRRSGALEVAQQGSEGKTTQVA